MKPTLSSRIVRTPMSGRQRSVVSNFIKTQKPSSAKLEQFVASIGPKSGRAVSVAAQTRRTLDRMA